MPPSVAEVALHRRVSTEVTTVLSTPAGPQAGPGWEQGLWSTKRQGFMRSQIFHIWCSSV